MKSISFCRYIKYFIVFAVGVLSGIYLYPLYTLPGGTKMVNVNVVMKPRLHEPNRLSRMLFIGGYPRSGTTLMRVLLDAHPDFNCGQETHIIPNLLSLQAKYSRGLAFNRLKETGIDLQLVNSTIAQSILTILKHRDPQLSRLCSKDPFTLKYIPYLSLIFPNAQFILMVRDARAVLHSIRSRDVKITNFPKTNKERFKRWSISVSKMLGGCLGVGPLRCIVVYYESLVMEPRFWMENILRFLRVGWNESVLKHTQYFNISGGIAVSRLEKSSDQVRQPIHQNSISSWVSSSLNISLKDLVTLAPTMNTLGYTEIGQPPNYSRLNQFLG